MKEPRRILFVTLSNIGDLVMTTPLLEALHLSYPKHLIDIVADRRSSELLRACPYRGRLLHRDKRAGLSGTVNLVMTLREHFYDVAVDLRSAFLTLFARCGQRGLKRRGTSAGPHAVQHHFTALRAILGADIEIPPARLWFDEDARNDAAALLQPQPDERILAVAPGANWPGKVWPVDRYAALIDDLGDSFDRVVVVGSQDDRALGEYLGAAAAMPLTNLAGATGLLAAAAVLSYSAGFVGNDSGLGHIAAALDIPGLTVFGPGQPARYRPWGPRAEIVLAPDADLNRLEPSVVGSAMRKLLRAQETVRPGTD